MFVLGWWWGISAGGGRYFGRKEEFVLGRVI